jgi:hypothetical protein
MPELEWDRLNTEAAWAAVTADAQLQEALVERLKIATGTADTIAGFTRTLEPSTFQLAGAEGDAVQLEWDEKPVPGVQIRQAAAAAAETLRSDTSLSAASVQQAPKAAPNRLTSDTALPEASVQQAPTAAAETLVVGPGLSAAAIAQAGTVHPDTAESRAAGGSVNAEQAPATAPAGLTSGTASENPLVQQAATAAPVGIAVAATHGKADARFYGDDFRSEQAGDTVRIEWGPSDKGLFEPDFRELHTARAGSRTSQVSARPATDDFRVGRVEGDAVRVRFDSPNKGQFS